MIRLIQQQSTARRQRDQRLKIPLGLVLIVPFVLLTVGTTGLVGYLSWRNGQRSVNELANQLMIEVSDRTQLYLSQYLETPHLINRLNATAIQLGQVDTTDPQRLGRIILEHVQSFSSVRAHFANPQGGLVGAGNDERGLTVSGTDNFTQGTLRVYGVDRQGGRTQLLVNRQNYDARQRPFYQAGLAAGKPTWTPIYVYVPASRGLGIAASYPLYDRDGNLQGILSSDLTLAGIRDYLRNLRVGTEGKVFIIERSGLLVASSTLEEPVLAQADPTQNERLDAAESQDPLVRLTVQYLRSHFPDISQISTVQQLQFDPTGKRKFLLVTPYNDAFGLDWLIVTVVPESSFMAQINAHTRTTLLLSAGALLGSIALGLWLTRSIVRPIRRLGQASLALAEGDWDKAVKLNSPIAELQVLNYSFDRMAEQLQQAFDRVKTALQESEEKFTKVFRTCPDPIGIVDQDGRYVEVNEAFVELFGYSREEVINRAAVDIGHWVDPADRQRYVQAVRAHGQVRNLEFAFCNKAGDPLTVLFSADRIELQGQPCIIGIAKDISARKQIELKLRQQQELRETIYNESTDAIFLVDPETLLITDCNRRAIELFEADNQAELIGIEGHTLQLQSFTVMQMGRIIAELDQKGFWSQEIEYVTKRGNHFWGNLAAKPVWIADQLIHLVRVTDISEAKQIEAERQQIEEALRQSEQLFRGAFATSAFGISIRSPQGKYLFVNESFCQMLGYTEAELLKLTYRDITHPDDLAIDPKNTIAKLVSGEVPYYHLEKRFLHKEGHVIWGLISMSLVRDLQQQPLYFVAQVQDISARKLAEAALRQSEARFQQIAAASPAQIYILAYYPDTDKMRFEYISSGVREIQELEPEQVLKDALLTFNQVHPDDRDAYVQATNQSFQTLEPFSHEWRIITPSGKIKWVQANSRPERRENGEIAWYGVLLDITARKQAEEALRQSEARFNQLADASPAIIYTVEEYPGRPVRFEYISPAFEEIHEIPLSEVRQNAMVAFDAFHPDDREGHQQAVMRAMEKMQPFRHEWRIITPTGKIKWIQGNSRPERRVDGTLVWHGVVIEITSLKEAEEALRQSEARFRSAFQDAPIGMALISLGDRWLKVNPVLCDMLGYSESDVLSMSASQLVHPDDADRLHQGVEQVLANENFNAQMELRYCCNGGRVAWGLLSLSLVRDAQNQPLYYIAQIQDITEQHAIDQLKTEFISIVSHELRTPLTAIHGSLSLLNAGIYDDDAEQAKQMIAIASSNTDRLVHLINDILDLERLSSGKVQLLMAACAAEALMQEAVKGLQPIADQAQVTLSVTSTPLQVWADADSIIQTLTNLVSNAIKFSPPHATVTLSVQHQPDFALFRVEDQGRGIPADKLEVIFGRFQQVDVSDARQKGGTGLGLAICQSIIQQHGGRIWAESALGEGSTFYFTLPLPA